MRLAGVVLILVGGWWGRRMKAQYAERLAEVNNQSAPPQLDFFPENYILTVTAATIGLLTQRLGFDCFRLAEARCPDCLRWKTKF